MSEAGHDRRVTLPVYLRENENRDPRGFAGRDFHAAGGWNPFRHHLSDRSKGTHLRSLAAGSFGLVPGVSRGRDRSSRVRARARFE